MLTWPLAVSSLPRAQVLRSDGSYTTATVEDSYEGVFEVLYSVRFPGGVVKPAVPEDEMYDASNADDPNFGVHFAAALAAAFEAEMLDSMMDDRCLCDD